VERTGNIVQAGKKILFKLLCLMVTCSLIGLSGCRKSSDKLEGEPLSEVLLRYTPEVGQTHDYKISMNLDKKIFYKGRWLKEGNEKLDLIFSILTIENNTEGFHTKFDIRWGGSNLHKETMDEMKDKIKAVRSIELTISDRYIWDKGGTHNLCFPDQPVSPGEEWEGEELFTFGDMATVDEPMLKMSYRLIKAVENKDGRYCLIECKPLTTQIEVPLQFGQLGLKCDTTGKVTAVRQDSDAQGKIRIGDILVAINGQKTVTPKDWHIMYERFIEKPDNVGDDILLAITRDGQKQDVNVQKSFVTLGTMEVEISKASRKVIFDIDKGIIVNDEDSPVYSVMYNFLDEFPFVDDYMGTGSFKGSAKTKVGPRIYYNRSKMKLIQ
jgi:hypothetical protein